MAALVTATTNGSGELTLTAVTAGQALDYSTTGPSVVNTLAGTGDSNIGAGVAQTNTVTVANGNALNAETFTVVVNGTSISYQNTSGTTENETTTAAGLVSRINADVNVNELVTASSAAGVVTITSDNIGTAFTQAASTAAGVQTAAEAAGVANTANAVSVTTANTLGDDSLLDIAASFVTAHETAINAAGFTIVDNADGTLDFTANTAGKSFTIASSVTNDAQTIDATSVTATQTVNVVATQTVTIAGNVDTGDVFSTTIQGGQAVSYTAASGDTITSVASGLRAALNANATNAAIATATTNGAGLITLTEAGLGAALTTTTASGTAAATSAFDVDGTSTSAAVKDLATGLVTDGDARFKVSSSGLSETVNITAAGGAVSASNGAWGNAISLTTTTGGFVAGEKSLLTIEDNTGQFQAVVTSNSATNKVNVSASSNTVVAASNSAWGSTLGIKGDDSLMVAGQTSIVAVTSTGGSGANDMQVDFNQDATAFINVEAVDVRSNGLGVNTAVNNWATTSNIDAAVAELNTALLTLRSNAQNLSTNLSVIKTRENFTANYINALTEGADKLTLADGNEEAANMLMLQTRQQLGIQALSMASQSAQSVLSLFR
jgi:flagellin